MIKPKRNCLRLLFPCLLVTLSGCAAIFAPSDGKFPDLSRVKVGAHRSVVEAELGKPVTDIRAEPGSGASRKVLYRYSTRDPIAEDASSYDKMVNGMVGITGHQLYVYYDAAGRLIQTETPRKNRAS